MINQELKQLEIVKRFQNEINEKKEPHTFLFISGDSFLSYKVMEIFAQALLCHDLCDECLNCKKLLSSNHPDVMYFPTKNQLLVEDSNKISIESFVKPIYADKKIFILKDFDKSTEEAQNKLLKIFEEPNENVYYFLSTTNIEKVLPTIRSRCFKIQLENLSKEQIEGQIIANCDKPLVLELGKNNLGKTLEVSRQKDLSEIVALAKSIFGEMRNSKQVVSYAGKVLAKKEQFALLIEIMTIILEDILLKICKKDHLITLQTQMPFLNNVSQDYSVRSVCEIEKLIRKVEEERSFNVNLSSIVDNLLLGILEVKYICK